MGEEGYVQHIVNERVQEIRERSDDHYKPFITTWCGRLDLAEKQRAQFASKYNVERAEIVEVESV